MRRATRKATRSGRSVVVTWSRTSPNAVHLSDVDCTRGGGQDGGVDVATGHFPGRAVSSPVTQCRSYLANTFSTGIKIGAFTPLARAGNESANELAVSWRPRVLTAAQQQCDENNNQQAR